MAPPERTDKRSPLAGLRRRGGPVDPRNEAGDASTRRTVVDHNGRGRSGGRADDVVVRATGRSEQSSLAGWPARPPRDDDTLPVPVSARGSLDSPTITPSSLPAIEADGSWQLATAEELAAAVGLPTDAATTGPLPVVPPESDPPTWVNRVVAPAGPLEEPLTAPPEAETQAIPVLRRIEPTGDRPPLVRRLVLARRNRPRVRKVSRVVRRVDAWSVFKISVLFWAAAYVILLVAGVLLWNLAYSTGTVSNVEGFIRNLFGLKKFTFDGQRIFHASYVLGAFLAVAGTGLFVTLAVLFNLISDLVGGVRVTVLEEEVVLRERPANRPVITRAPARTIDETPAPADNLSSP
jgi:hypothetical protein